MRNSPEDQEERHQDAPAEPPADLLRRALSHVEDLLGRLEYPTVKHDDLPDLTDEDQDELSIFADEPVDALAPAAPHPEPEPEALAVTLTSDPAPRIDEQAGATADTVLSQARRDADLIRAEGRAEAEHLLGEAALEAERILAAAEEQARQRVTPGAATGAHGQSGAEEPVSVDAARTSRDARAAAAERAHARELLDRARFALAGVRSEVQALREALLFSVGSIESAERAIDALLDPPGSGAPAPSGDSPTAAESAVTR